MSQETLPDTPPPEYDTIDQVDEKAGAPPPCVSIEAAVLPLLSLGGAEVLLLEPPAYTVEDPQEQCKPAAVDPWELGPQKNVPEPKPWSELSTCGRVRKVCLVYLGKPLALLTLLYLFICSLDFLSSAFRLLGGKAAGSAFSDNELLRNPISGLMIGILSTVLVQSSSTSTSIIVTMVASGIMPVSPAVPIVMGANIGTSVTNTIVSLAQSSQRDEFRRAFAGATVHDMFNWLSVLVLLPLEAATGYLERLTGLMVQSINMDGTHGSKNDMLKALTKPFTSLVIQLDKSIIEKIATGHTEYADKSLIKVWCKYETETRWVNATFNATSDTLVNVTQDNMTGLVEETVKVPVEQCHFLFHNTGLGDSVIGLLLLVFSLFMLCTCLVFMVKLLHSILQGRIASIIKSTLNASFPGRLSFLTGYVALLIGAGMTILVQSSSVFTSAMTPLVGIGVIRLERMYPLTLGSNIGTTATSLLAAMAASGDKLQAAVQIGLCHLFFNISGIILFYPIPFMRLPISLAKMMGDTTAKYRWFAVFYLVVMFFIMPGAVFALSMLGTLVLTSVISVILTILFFVVVINILQNKRPNYLPSKLRSWDFLPEWMHSFDPLDRVICKAIELFRRCCPFKRCQKEQELETSIRATEMVPLGMEYKVVLPENFAVMSALAPERTLYPDSASNAVMLSMPVSSL